MDISAIAEFVKTYLLPHWPFFFMSFMLGLMGNVMKNKVWTQKRASRSKVFYWIRAFLPLHAPLAGAVLGMGCGLLFPGHVLASPGVESPGQLMMYYMGAGGFSAWVFNAFKHFAESRGVNVPDEFDGDSDSPPPPSSLSEPEPDPKKAA